MQAARRAQDTSGGARETMKKRGRTRSTSSSSIAAPPSIVGSDSGGPRRRPRQTQPAQYAGGPNEEKLCASTSASAGDETCTLRSSAQAEKCTSTKSGSPESKETALQNVVTGGKDDTLQSSQKGGSSTHSGEGVYQTSVKSRNARQEGVTASGRPCSNDVLLHAGTSYDADTSLPSAGHASSTQRPPSITGDKGRVKALQQALAERLYVPSAASASCGTFVTPKEAVPVEEDKNKAYSVALDFHKQVQCARFNETGQLLQKPAASTGMIQLLLGKQFPSCTASAVSLLEKRLQAKLGSSNEECSTAKPVSEHDRIDREARITEEEVANRRSTGDADPNRTSAAGVRVHCSGMNREPSGSSTLQTHVPTPLYYTVHTGNGLHCKEDGTVDTECREEDADHKNYPVVKGVSRDNTKKRWAVYWKGSRKYFYDKCYADCHQAYLSAVEFRRQAKACNAPGPPPKKPHLQGEFYLPPTAPSFRFAPYPPGITGFSLAPSNPPAFPLCEIAPPCAALLAKCSSVPMTLPTTLPERQAFAPTRLSELSVSFSEKDALSTRSDPDPCTSSPTTADSCDNVTDTVQVYRCTAILLLQDLLHEVLPARIVALSSARRTAFLNPALKTRAEERFLSASLLLLHRTLQGHIARAERGGEEDLNQLLTVLMPSLERQLLPSELPRELQQQMLLQLTTLRL